MYAWDIHFVIKISTEMQRLYFVLKSTVCSNRNNFSHHYQKNIRSLNNGFEDIQGRTIWIWDQVIPAVTLNFLNCAHDSDYFEIVNEFQMVIAAIKCVS